ncbi:hypothetical protein [Sulfitobacter sabulilitoris]|uniref:Uncharacterized protein n=1 Tax=Sulfitobacter sabulilitoris TaxID=2562655 RepID=A0A5S3P8G2_9RHOB|nr:hypothetical protein [Sulfitobacter sabulilitoris]TMM49559.1 hypothetical protein FDT80_17575 [Sulfitobacter sabulilitoris]
MDATDRNPAFYTCEVITKCFVNDETRKEFMDAYGESPEAAQAYLEKLGMPAKLAEDVSKKQGNDLNLFIGKNVCDYLW